jgi:hypothetical protein
LSISAFVSPSNKPKSLTFTPFNFGRELSGISSERTKPAASAFLLSIGTNASTSVDSGFFAATLFAWQSWSISALVIPRDFANSLTLIFAVATFTSFFGFLVSEVLCIPKF